MKTKKITRLLTLAFCAIAFAFVTSCEGPQGPAGADGTDGLPGSDGTPGVDGNVTCLECHSGENMQAIKEQFYQSVHSAGQIAVDYAGGRSSCAQCHSSEGFIEFARNGTVEENIAAPSPWECATCHGLHTTFESTDYALRLDDPIDFIFDGTVSADFGNSNLCVNCHQTRRAEPNVSNPGTEFTVTSSHYGPHHGPQGNLLNGVGFANIAGSMEYPGQGASTHFTSDDGKCTGCHMGTYGNGAGGHTYNPGVDACTSCHAGATDFDIGGVQTAIAADLDILRDLLVDEGIIVYDAGDYYELDPDTGDIVLVSGAGSYHPVRGTYPMIVAQAFFNWDAVLEDRSLGVHNPAYAQALLTNSIEALNE